MQFKITEKPLQEQIAYWKTKFLNVDAEYRDYKAKKKIQIDKQDEYIMSVNKMLNEYKQRMNMYIEKNIELAARITELEKKLDYYDAMGMCETCSKIQPDACKSCSIDVHKWLKSDK